MQILLFMLAASFSFLKILWNCFRMVQSVPIKILGKLNWPSKSKDKVLVKKKDADLQVLVNHFYSQYDSQEPCSACFMFGCIQNLV